MTRALLVAALVLVPFAAWGQDFETGLRAYESGDYEQAMEEWRPLAEQGHAAAQAKLGTMYSKGNGVPLDLAQAVRWFRLAAEQSDAGGNTPWPNVCRRFGCAAGL